MFLQEMKFDTALKGTASCMTPGPLKAIPTPQEQIKNASSLIWSDICFFSKFKEGFFLLLQALDAIRPSPWQSTITTNPALWLRPAWDPLHMDGQEGETPSGSGQPKPHYFMKDVWNPANIWVWSNEREFDV